MSADPVGKVNSSAGSEKSLAESTQGNSLNRKKYKSLQLSLSDTSRKSIEQLKKVTMIKLGRWGP